MINRHHHRRLCFLSRQITIIAQRPTPIIILINKVAMPALFNKDPFSAHFYGGFTLPPDVVGTTTCPMSKISTTSALTLRRRRRWRSSCSDGPLHQRVHFLKPRALPPYPLLLHNSIPRLDEHRDSTTTTTTNNNNNNLTMSGGGRPVLERGSPLGLLDRSMPKKLVVAVDVDEVLGSFVSALNKFIAERYSLNHTVSEYHVYEFFKIWNCSRDEADIRVHEFFKTSYFKNGIHPIPGARVALHKLSSFCNLSIVTSRQNAIKDHTIEWIEKHYPGLFQEIHFGNHFALDGKSRPKSEICRSLGAHVLIDDNPRYAIECAEVGIKVLLFDYENSYPWCKTDSAALHPLVTKVHNWEEVEQQLDSWIIS